MKMHRDRVNTYCWPAVQRVTTVLRKSPIFQSWGYCNWSKCIVYWSDSCLFGVLYLSRVCCLCVMYFVCFARVSGEGYSGPRVTLAVTLGAQSVSGWAITHNSLPPFLYTYCACACTCPQRWFMHACKHITLYEGWNIGKEFLQHCTRYWPGAFA